MNAPSSLRWILLVALLGGCALARPPLPTPIPLRGAPPQVIAVWPLVTEPFQVHRDELLAALAPAAQRRGYRVISAPVVEQMLGDYLLLANGVRDLTVVGMRLEADAVIDLDVRRFEVDVDRVLRFAAWDLTWRLESTRGNGTLWQYEHHGNWRANDVDRGDPMRRIDEDPVLAPAAERGPPGFRDAAELLAWLHQDAMLHLPEMPR